MRWEFTVGLRYLRSRRKETFLSVITVISTLGVLLGVSVMTITLSVMTGFEEDLRSRILGLHPHLRLVNRLSAGTVEGADLLADIMEEDPRVVEAAPIFNAQFIISSGGQLTGVYARGIDASSGGSTFGIVPFITDGNLSDLKRTARIDGSDLRGIMVGKALARQLGVTMGDVVNVMSPTLTANPLGVMPRSKRFYIAAMYDSGMAEYDSGLVYLAIEDARAVVGVGPVASGVEARVTDPYDAPEIAEELSEKVGMPYWVQSWTEAHRNVFAALKLEKTVYFLVLMLILLVAAFAIVATLYMVVMEKRRDIAVLKAMGATSSSVAAIFVLKGLLIGTLGTALGALSGFVACLGLERYQFVDLPEGVFYVSTLPVRIEADNFLLVCAASMAICLLASVFPAWKASRVVPVDILRYE